MVKNDMQKEKKIVEEYLSGKPLEQLDLGEDILEGTETIPPTEALKFLIIQARNECFSLMNIYRERCYFTGRPNIRIENKLKTKIMHLYAQIQAALKVDYPEKYAAIEQLLIYRRGVRHYIEAFNMIEDYLYEKKLTRFDTIKRYNEHSAEARNKIWGV